MFPPQENEHGVFVLDATVLDGLKRAALASPMRRARICLHTDLNAPVQEMVIALCNDSDIRPHKHPRGKPESYHLIEGEMDVRIFDAAGAVLQRVRLCDAGPRMYRIVGDVWHQPLAVTPLAVYHEVYTGPFDKATDVRYEEWSRDEV